MITGGIIQSGVINSGMVNSGVLGLFSSNKKIGLKADFINQIYGAWSSTGALVVGQSGVASNLFGSAFVTGARTVRGSSGLMTDFAANSPAYAYDYETKPIGMMLEGPVAQKLSNISQFGSWGANNGVTVTADTTVSPNGTQDADTLTYAAGGAAARQDFTATAAAPIVFGAFLKKGSANREQLLVFNTTGAATVGSIVYDLTLETVAVQYVGTGTLRKFDPNWYLCIINIPSAVAITNSIRAYIYTGESSPVGSYCYAWGANLQEWPFMSSLIGTATTRAADNIVRVLGAEWSASGNEILVTGRSAPGIGGGGGTQTLFQFDKNADNNDRIIVYRDSSRKLRVRVDNASVNQLDIDCGYLADDTNFTLAMRAKTNDFAVTRDGGALITNTSCTMPAVTHLRLGVDKAAEYWFGSIGFLQTAPL